MKVLSRDHFIPPENGCPVFPGFVTYISNRQPILMHRWGRVDYSDAYDDYVDQISPDNGCTWSKPVLHLKGYPVPGGKIRYGEPAALFDPDTEKLIVITNKNLYPNDRLNVDRSLSVVLDTYDPAAGAWSEMTPLDIDSPWGVGVSFCRPIKTSRGRLVFPGQTRYLDANGKPLHYKGCWSPAGVITHILGDYQADGSIRWRLSRPVVPDLEKTSRGFYEPALAELADGRFAMILRGDNSMYPDRPGYKWLSFSEDHCENWSDPAPLPCDTGELLESGSNGSGLFRSFTNGKLYWIGTLCIDGERPNGNWPRSPLLIAEVREDPFALRRDTLTVIDRRQPDEPAHVQLSNFRFYQDRATGDVVLFLTRFGEHGTTGKEWMQADYYRYRIGLDV